tara:strand:+ start:577 stop:756 length:180 start_codon:yes stop_codon:yes gene_type:complete
MHDTEKTAPQSSYELLEASFAQYKQEHCLDNASVELVAMTRPEIIIVGMYQRLLEELSK